jgi:hypothetical protein
MRMKTLSTESTSREMVVKIFDLAIVTIIAIALGIYLWESAFVLVQMDWGLTETFDEFLRRILLALAAFELIQVMRTSYFRDLFFVALFILMRKAIDPFTPVLDSVVLLVAFVGILTTWLALTKWEIVKADAAL